MRGILLHLLILIIAILESAEVGNANNTGNDGTGYGWWNTPGAEHCGTRVSVAVFKSCVDEFGLEFTIIHSNGVDERAFIINWLAGDVASGTDQEKIEKLSYLLEKGADPNRLNRLGRTPLASSLSSQRTPAVSYLLIQHGADLNVVFKNVFKDPYDCGYVCLLERNNRGLRSFPKLLSVLKGEIKLKPLSSAMIMKSKFVSLKTSQRKEVQINLKGLGLYKSSIDGLYGKGTKKALTAYNEKYLGGADLTKPEHVTRLLDTIIDHKTAPTQTAEPKPNLTIKEPQITEAEPKEEVSPSVEPEITPEQTTAAKSKKTMDLAKKFGLSLYGSFLHSDKLPNALFFFDNIEDADSFEFRKALRNHDIDMIVLSSPGGSVMEGLNMAGIINDKRLNTFIPENSIRTGGGNCASACAFMFFAGENRNANGKLGVHQFYSKDSTQKAEIGDTQKIAQFTVSEIIGFLNEFETPPWVYERMFQQSNMYYFKESELLKLESESTEAQKDSYKETENFIAELRAAFGDM